MSKKFKFKCGDVVRDQVTGLEGIVTARSQWLHNCNTYRVQPQELKDGKPVDSSGFDEPQLDLVKKKPKNVAKSPGNTGGPTPSVDMDRTV